MSTGKHIGIISCVMMVICIAISLILSNGSAFNIQSEKRISYEDKLFDTSYVHNVQIVTEHWDELMNSADIEEYQVCSVMIDGHKETSVGIRIKGDISKSIVSEIGSSRYSFKIEFDQYDKGNLYYGLDKLCLNNIISDTTYMKDYLTYEMMRDMGIPAPLCSYVDIYVNGEHWGLYLAVEGIEDAFMERNFGKVTNEWYKPDLMVLGGTEATIENFDVEEFMSEGGFDPPLFGIFAPPMAPEMQEAMEEVMQEEAPTPPDSGEGFESSLDDVRLIVKDTVTDNHHLLLASAKTDITEEDFTRLLSSLKQMNDMENLEIVLDTDEIIRYFAIHNFVVNKDSYTGDGAMIHNYYLSEDNGRLSMLPWDYNLAFGTFDDTPATDTINQDIFDPVSGDYHDYPMFSWIVDILKYRGQYEVILSEFVQKWCESGYYESFIDDTDTLISKYVQEDPTAFCTYDEYQKGIAALKKYMLLRGEAVSNQLEGNYEPVDTSALSIKDMGTRDGRTGGVANPGSPLDD